MKQSILKQLARVNGTSLSTKATLPDGTVVDLAAAAYLDQADPETIANAYGVLMSARFKGHVSAWYDEDRRKVCIHGNALPTSPPYATSHGISTWTLVDYETLRDCRLALLEAMNDSLFRQSVMAAA